MCKKKRESKLDLTKEGISLVRKDEKKKDDEKRSLKLLLSLSLSLFLSLCVSPFLSLVSPFLSLGLSLSDSLGLSLSVSISFFLCSHDLERMRILDGALIEKRALRTRFFPEFNVVKGQKKSLTRERERERERKAIFSNFGRTFKNKSVLLSFQNENFLRASFVHYRRKREKEREKFTKKPHIFV